MSVIRITQNSRGCGTRVKGGLYAFFDLSTVRPCPNLPLPLPEICSCCGEGIRQCRGIRYVTPIKLLPPVKTRCSDDCPVCNPTSEKAGLMWVGNQYYTATQFLQEAQKIGASKRIPAVPDLPIGSVVYFVHPHAIRIGNAVFDESEAPRHVLHSQTKPGIFLTAKLTALHKIIDEEQAKDEKLIARLEEQGITAVIEVPESVTEKHVLMSNAPKGESLFRATCPRCDKLYGYTGKNPKYCPDCLVIIKKREVENAPKQKTVETPLVKVTKKKKTKKVK